METQQPLPEFKIEGSAMFIPTALPLVSENDPILKQKTERFDFDNPPMNPVQLYQNLGRTLMAHDALGLAAPQVGLPYRFFVLRTENILGVFNPILVDKSEEEVTMEEGCLSFVNLFIKIKRPQRIRARFTTPDGQTQTAVFDGMTARAFLHEYDHLEGKVFTTVANRFHLDAGRKKRHLIKSGRYTVSHVIKEA
jgi:peptide deformylase